MMRQAVPLLNSESPIVGTGIEGYVARDSRVLINAEGDGIVEYVDANEIRIRYARHEEEKLVSFEDDLKTYLLTKFKRTNQNTSINLRPIVNKGDKVIADFYQKTHHTRTWNELTELEVIGETKECKKLRYEDGTMFWVLNDWEINVIEKL